MNGILPSEAGDAQATAVSEVDRAPTGFPALDAQLEGGLPAGRCLLLLAEPTNAAYRFLERFAATGLQAHQPTLYYSLERPRDEIVPRILNGSHGSPPPPALGFMDYYAQKLRALNEEVLGRLGVTNHCRPLPEQVVADLTGLSAAVDCRVVLESLSEAANVYGVDAALGLLNHACALLRKSRGTALVLMIKGEHDAHVEARARHLADGVLEFGVHHQGLGATPYLAVTKMPDLDDESRVFLYKSTRQGLWFECTRRVL